MLIKVDVQQNGEFFEATVTDDCIKVRASSRSHHQAVAYALEELARIYIAGARVAARTPPRGMDGTEGLSL